MNGKHVPVLALLGILIFLGAWVLALPAEATHVFAPRTISDLYVNPNPGQGTDTGNCQNAGSPCATIGYAVTQAVSSTIHLATGTYNESVVLPAVKYIVLQGPIGSELQTVIKGQITASGPQVGINNLTITNDAGTTVNGAGLYVNGSVTQVVFLRNSNLIGNVATGNGGAAYVASGSLTIIRTAIYNNSAGSGGAIYNNTGASTYITQTAVFTNTGGAVVNSGFFTATNSTIAASIGNGVASSGGKVGLFNATVANNSGIGLDVTGGTAKIENSILALNTTDCSGTLSSSSYNLIGNSSCGLTNGVSGNKIGTGGAPIAPDFGPVGLNRGPNLNYPLLMNGPAVNAGNPGGCKDDLNNLLLADQRAEVRPIGPACDMGSFELQQYIPSFLPMIQKH